MTGRNHGARGARALIGNRLPDMVIWWTTVLMTAILLTIASGAGAAKKPSNPRIGHRLAAVIDAWERGGAARGREMAELAGIRPRGAEAATLIPVVVEKDGGAAGGIDPSGIEAIGARVDAVSRSFVRVLVPPGAVRRLTAVAGVSAVRLATPAKALAPGLGDAVSQAVDLTGAGPFQEAGFVGEGVKIAVVDLGFIGLQAAQDIGELPPVVRRVKGNTEDVDIDGFTVHGTGVAEHVMDMAPGAELFCILVEDEVDLENAADYIRDNGILIANHSVGWVNASYYDDTGPISGIINRSRDVDGVFWTVAAGNDAQTHWRGDWLDPDGNDTLDFAAGDEELGIVGTYSLVQLFLNWNQYGDSRTDLDLYVLDNAGQVVAVGGGAQTGAQPPAEAVAFAWTSEGSPYSIQVRRYSGPTDGLDITLFSFNHRFDSPVGAASFMEPADARGAFSVGAIFRGLYADSDPPLESYSSRGPTTDGRLKPDIAAPDGTTSVAYGDSYGTSFSAPTTAGAAAILRQLYPGIGPAALGDTLRALAIDAGPVGADNEYGAGKLAVSVAFDSLPAVEAIEDVAGDEGLFVEVDWKRSGYDRDNSPVPVSAYDVLRLDGGAWEQVATVSADAADRYSAVVPTLGDSSAAGVVWTVLKVRARNESGRFFESPPDSGFSVANIVTDAGDVAPPPAFALHQNTPNPFNPTTTIRFDLRERTRVRLAIYDVGGRLVRLLVDGARPAGLNEIRWDGRDRGGRPVASGIYFYRLAAPGMAATRKMTLLR